MSRLDLKPCPFCGGEAVMCGQEVKDFYDGKWARESRKEYWVKPYCLPSCVFGNTHSTAFGIIDGLRYTTPKLAADAWNRRADDGTT